jgi:hypothetical protein
MYGLHLSQPLDRDTTLYWDWEYFQRTSGGFNSAGLGIPWASVSVGWNKSIQRLFNKKIGGRLTEIKQVCSKNEVVVTGYIAFPDDLNASSLTESMTQKMEMEGAYWISAIVSSAKISPDAEYNAFFTDDAWLVALFREDRFVIPRRDWRLIEQPINIFADVLPFGISLPVGNRPCLLKVRGAAFIMDY